MGKAAPKTSKYDKFRREELAKIHIGKSQLRLGDEVYRDILWQAGRVESSADLDWQGRQAVLERFKELGWQPKHKGKTPGKPSRILADDPQSKKIRALWLELHAAGRVRDPSEKALASYVKRMTGVAALQWLRGDQASTVIEALKKWLER
ncbi:gp16 family protein [Geobacter sp.]|uniref:gp16 family protein n=1 Tax=Geobacter sp. TaxID=46610 RepID=UPI00263283B4|nr:regulatory protein GemA [Geobacter sp.]